MHNRIQRGRDKRGFKIMSQITQKEIDKLHNKLYKEAEEAGYHLNPDVDFTKALVKSLLINENRYGYPSCPCRLASGKKEDDLDIICPCDYRDSDLNDYGTCFCALYVSKKIKEGKKKPESIPERRPTKEEIKNLGKKKKGIKMNKELDYPVWRCKVCGYLVARDEPPEVCPVCKAKKDRFERFM